MRRARRRRPGGRISRALCRRSRVGILAFGSIAKEPGTELDNAVTKRVKVQTPFKVEFARSSSTRDGAPTLVPVGEKGAHVPAMLFVLDDSVTVADARAMLYRRETGRLNDQTAGSPAAWIAELPRFKGTRPCLYTALPANIRPLTPAKLAELAVSSAAAPAGAEWRDGISYLQQQKRRRLTTPLMDDYEEAVLARTGARDLAGAWERARFYQPSPLDQKEIDLGWDLVMRGLERQPEILSDLRGRTGTLLAAAGVVVSVVIGFFVTNSSSIGLWSWILLLAGLLPAALAVRECSLVLRSLPYDKYNTDLMAYVAVRGGQPGRRAFGLWTAAGDKNSSTTGREPGDRERRPSAAARAMRAWRRLWARARTGSLDKRLERRVSKPDLRDADDPLTLGQLWRVPRKALDTSEPRAGARRHRSSRKEPYRWWRVTLNQREVRKLREVACSADRMSTPDDITAELTSFLSLTRRSNWLVIDELSAAFSLAAVFFVIQLVLWIVAAAVLHRHGVGATPHK